jgi:hypothetical protein
MQSEMVQAMQAQVYGHPNTYPNSEHIKPPLLKERIRVVEAATRTDLKLEQTKQVEERMEELQALRDQAAVRYDAHGNNTPITYTEGEFVDIEV